MKGGFPIAILERYLVAFEQFVQTHLWFAPLSAVLLPLAEALMPWLPLTALVSFNLSAMAMAYGSLWGTMWTILLTVLGSFMGMFLIFLFIRATFSKRFIDKVHAHPFGKKFLGMVQENRIWMVWMLLCNPFLPSSVMNYAISLTPISVPKYVGLTLGSRVVTISFLIFLGSLFNLQEHPLNVVWLMLVYGVLFLLVAWIQNRRNRRSSS
jgi:uncharacterized membrane protein YdjX (TVP38/TMEM64 family)